MALTIGVIGQSNGQRWNDAVNGGTDLTANAKLTVWNGAAFVNPGTTANGQISFANALIASTGEDVRLINSAIGGSSLSLAAENGFGYWLDTAVSSIYDDFKTDVAAAVGSLTLDAVIIINGERDAVFGISEAVFDSDLTGLINDQIRTDFAIAGPFAPLPVVIMRLGDIDATPAGQLTAIRNAQVSVGAALANCVTSVDNSDIPLIDNVHYTPAGYTTHGTRAFNSYTELRESGQMQFGYVVESNVGLFTGLPGAEWLGAVNHTDDIGENNLLYPTISEDFTLQSVKIRGKSTAGDIVNVRVYDTENSTVATQRRPTGSPLWSGTIIVPLGPSEAEHSVIINELIPVTGSIIPCVVAYGSSGAGTTDISNTNATWTTTPTAARSTDGLVGATWGNAGDKQAVMFADYVLGGSGSSPTLVADCI